MAHLFRKVSGFCPRQVATVSDCQAGRMPDNSAISTDYFAEFPAGRKLVNTLS
jgi:hypothetical protein